MGPKPDTPESPTMGDVERWFSTDGQEQRLELLEGMDPRTEIVSGVTAGAAVDLIRAGLAPASPRSGFKLQANEAYGTAGAGGRALTLNLYTRSAKERLPGIVFIHGGGWRGGNQNHLSNLASEMATYGYVTASISYRLSGESRWPAALEDSKCAIRWMRAHAGEIGVDPRRIAVAGASAGAHLAAMVALTPGRFEGHGGWETTSSDVQAVVLYSPVIDLSGLISEYVEAFLGGYGRQLVAEASPASYITSACPPVLTRVGDLDDVTPPTSAVLLHETLDKVGVPNQLEVIPGEGHGIQRNDVLGCIDATTRFLGEHFR